MEGADLPGKGQDRLRAGAQLLLLPRRHGGVSHRGDTVGDRLVQIQVFLLRDRHADSAGGAAGAIRVRFPVPLRVVSGADSQDSAAQKEAVHEEAQAAAVSQVPDPAADGDAAADLHQRGGAGRSLLLQVPVSAGRAGGRDPAVPGQRQHALVIMGAQLLISTAISLLSMNVPYYLGRGSVLARGCFFPFATLSPVFSFGDVRINLLSFKHDVQSETQTSSSASYLEAYKKQRKD